MPPQKRCKISEALAGPLAEKEVPKIVKSTNPPEKESVINSNNNNINDNTVNFDLFPDFDQDNDIPNDQILQVLSQIEDENKDLFPITNKENSSITVPDPQPQAESNKTINFSNISNVCANVNCTQMMPTMYFANSNVNIHYHFNK